MDVIACALIKRLFCTVIILCPIFCGLCGTQSQLRLRQKGIVILKQIDRFITLIPPKMKSFQRIFCALNAFQFVSFTTQLLIVFLVSLCNTAKSTFLFSNQKMLVLKTIVYQKKNDCMEIKIFHSFLSQSIYSAVSIMVMK